MKSPYFRDAAPKGWRFLKSGERRRAADKYFACGEKWVFVDKEDVGIKFHIRSEWPVIRKRKRACSQGH